MTETTAKLIDVARQRRSLFDYKPNRGFFPNPNRKALAALICRERIRLGRIGLLRRICHRGKPILP